MGIMVWSEVPVYWMIDWENPATLANATHQLQEMIRRDRNKASVVLWSVANETPNTPPRLAFLKSLINTAPREDPTRPVTAALLVTTLPTRRRHRTKVLDDPLGEYLDVLGCNEYIGWYEGTPDLAARTRWKSKYNKPLIMSEFGGDAKAGLHGRPRALDRGVPGEHLSPAGRDAQADSVSARPEPVDSDGLPLSATHAAGVQDYYNRKGLVSNEGQKKKAFFVLQEYYKSLATTAP